MRLSPIQIYVASIIAAAAMPLPFLEWGLMGGISGPHLFGLASLVLLGLLSESLAIPVAESRSAASITFIPLLSCLLLFGPPPALLLVTITGWFGERIVRNKEPLRATFNVAQFILGVGLGGLAYAALGGSPVALSADNGPVSMLGQMAPLLAFGMILLGVNNLTVTAAIAIARGLSVERVGRFLIGQSGGNLLYDLLISPVALVVAFLYLELSFWGILLALLPLVFIRHAYLNTLRLQQANRSLLKALVKAIETRDPYTSGHSLRVANLAKQIAQRLGLSRRMTEDTETAALLHDIGKIDAVYTDILKSPASLSPEERDIIESHVTKGVELLTQLSFFGPEVIAAVRYHHERVDGKGYPDGLIGDEIPVAAKIIKVCDAIDAMLSDRPYRDALKPDVVREQLEVYSGTQFDPVVVRAALEGEMIEEYAADYRLSDDVESTLALPVSQAELVKIAL